MKMKAAHTVGQYPPVLTTRRRDLSASPVPGHRSPAGRLATERQIWLAIGSAVHCVHVANFISINLL